MRKFKVGEKVRITRNTATTYAAKPFGGKVATIHSITANECYNVLVEPKHTWVLPWQALQKVKREDGPLWQPGSFGEWLIYPLPDGCRSVVLCKVTRYGTVPECILLPHQIYRKQLLKRMKDDSDITGFLIMPRDACMEIEISAENIRR